MGNSFTGQRKFAITPQNNPLKKFDHFLAYIDAVNDLAQRNESFLRAQLNIV